MMLEKLNLGDENGMQGSETSEQDDGCETPMELPSVQVAMIMIRIAQFLFYLLIIL